MWFSFPAVWNAKTVRMALLANRKQGRTSGAFLFCVSVHRNAWLRDMEPGRTVEKAKRSSNSRSDFVASWSLFGLTFMILHVELRKVEFETCRFVNYRFPSDGIFSMVRS